MRKRMSLAGLMAAAGLLIGLSASVGQASVVFSDQFDYPIGDSLNWNHDWGNQNWGGGSYHAQVGTGLSYAGLTTVGGSADVLDGGIFRNISTSSSDTYISVLVQRTNTSGALGVFFSQGWNQPAIAGFGINQSSRLFAANGGFSGYSSSASTSTTALNTPILLIGHLDSATMTMTVWDYANPANTASYAYGSASLPATVNLYSNSGATGLIDEIQIGTTLADVTPVPEPASLVLLGAGSLLALSRRRHA